MTKQERIILGMQNKIYRYKQEMQATLSKLADYPFCDVSVLGKPVPVYSGKLEYLGENMFGVSGKEFFAEDILDILFQDHSIQIILGE